jgi:uncharacterized protein (TIGR02145 family)
VDAGGNWTNWNGPWDSGLKLHAAGLIFYDGSFGNRGTSGLYWSSKQYTNTMGNDIFFNVNSSYTNTATKVAGIPVRCVMEGGNTIPSVITTLASGITQTTASSGGNVTLDGGSAVTERGVCWSTSANPTITENHTSDGSGTGVFSSSLTGLLQYNLYYVRAYATNSVGTSYGNEVSFYTLAGPCPGVPTLEYEGTTYNTIQIGTQCWLKENLNIGIRINGSQDQIDNGVIEKYCYNNLESNCDTYGGLYLWNEMMNYSTTPGIMGICPVGWHIPTNNEWDILMNYLGGQSVSGGPMKESGTTHWASPNTGATNSSGFTALPGGTWDWDDQMFYSLSQYGLFSSSTQTASTSAYYRYLAYFTAIHGISDATKHAGRSVRCIKD